MAPTLLDTLNFPNELKTLSYQELLQLSNEIRERLIDITNRVGGHLASNLGVVELTIALTPCLIAYDKFLWDTHQTYVHEMLTGRLNDMYTIKQRNLSGFAKISEKAPSVQDMHPSLSPPLAWLKQEMQKKKPTMSFAFLGMGAIRRMAYEALNNIKALNGNFICVLNDNDMSISPPVGAMANYITSIRTTKLYDNAKIKFQRILNRVPKIGSPLKRRIEKVVERLRNTLLDTPTGVLFEEFGFKYLGPINGHDLPSVMAALRYAKEYPGPIMLHMITKKGKGMDVAESNPIKYHGVSAKSSNSNKKKAPTYTQCLEKKLINCRKKRPDSCHYSRQEKEAVWLNMSKNFLTAITMLELQKNMPSHLRQDYSRQQCQL